MDTRPATRRHACWPNPAGADLGMDTTPPERPSPTPTARRQGWGKAALLLAILGPDIHPADPLITAAPAVVVHGTSITISGSGFGLHPDFNAGAATWKGQVHLAAGFKDFEDGSLTSGGFDSGNRLIENVSIAAGGPAHSTGHLTTTAINSRLTSYGITQSGNDQGTLFTSFWYKQAGTHRSGKMWRWFFGPDSSNDNLYVAAGPPGSPAQLVLAGDYMAQNAPALRSAYGPQFATDVWHKLEIFASKPRNAYVVHMDGVEYLNIAAQSSTMWSHPHTMAPDGHTVDMPSMSERGDVSPFNYDDVYIDYTQARVELAAGGTWATRGICNTQIPIAWSDTTVRVMVNQGSFAPGQRYLYVVTADGRVNASGIPVSCTPGGGNAAPVAHDQSVATSSGSAVPIILTASDADGDDLTFAIAAPPLHGTLSIAGAACTYVPAAGFSGTDAFSFTASDGAAASAPARVSIAVAADSAAGPATGTPDDGGCGRGALGLLLAGAALIELRRRAPR